MANSRILSGVGGSGKKNLELFHDFNYFEHAKMITAEDMLFKYVVGEEYLNNKILSEYIDYFNKNYTCNGQSVTIHYNKSKYAKLRDEEFWKSFYEIMTKSGYLNIRIVETNNTYEILADLK